MMTQQEVIQREPVPQSSRGPEFAYRIAAALAAIILLLTLFRV